MYFPSLEHKILLQKSRNKGNFKHNSAVLHGGMGPMTVNRRPKTKAVEGSLFIAFTVKGCMFGRTFGDMSADVLTNQKMTRNRPHKVRIYLTEA